MHAEEPIIRPFISLQCNGDHQIWLFTEQNHLIIFVKKNKAYFHVQFSNFSHLLGFSMVTTHYTFTFLAFYIIYYKQLKVAIYNH